MAVLSATGIAVVYWIINSVLQFVLSFLFSLILTLLDWFTKFLLKPFDFAPDMFVAVFGTEVTEGIEEVAISAGLAISVLLLIFGLIRVFSGRFNDDVPNPFALVGRFIIAVICNYWIITIIYKYVFPLAQKFFNKALSIGSSENLIKTKFSNAVTNITDIGGNGGFDDAAIVVDQAMTGLTQSLGIIIILIIFAIGVIAFVINVFKLIVENAERYFTINLLVVAAPLATSTIVSEKSIGIFKSWWQMMMSNILTIIFNIIGFRMLVFAFNNCMTAWLEKTFNIPLALTSIVALVAASKMVQKFDQLLSLLTFKINPIQNRSLIMGVLGGIAGLQKGVEGVGKAAQGVGKIPEKFANSSLNPGRLFHKNEETGEKTPLSVKDALKQDFSRMGSMFGINKEKPDDVHKDADINKDSENSNFNTKFDKNNNLNKPSDTLQDRPLENIPFNFKSHYDSLKAANSNVGENNKANQIPINPDATNKNDITTPTGFEAMRNALEDKENSIYGLREDDDGNLSVVLGPRGGEGGIAPDTIKSAQNGGTYYFDTIGDESPYDSLPQGKYIAGAEVLDYKYDDPSTPSKVRYYMTNDQNYASPKYHKKKDN